MGYKVVNGDEPTWGPHGTMAIPRPVTIRTELRATVEALRLACPHLRLTLTINKWPSDGTLENRGIATSDGKALTCYANFGHDPKM